MDFTQAALLIAAIFSITTLLDQAIPQLHGWILQLANAVIGIVVTFLVAYSTYADSVTVGKVTLDNVNVAGLILIGLMASGGATLFDRTFRAVSNVGENQNPVAPVINVPPLDVAPPEGFDTTIGTG